MIAKEINKNKTYFIHLQTKKKIEKNDDERSKRSY